LQVEKTAEDTMTNTKIQARYDKLIAKAGDDMTERQAERYFHQVVALLDEMNELPCSQNKRLQLARIAGSLQFEYPNFC
jgi:predicted ArsR family transcriptional regulator